MKTSPVYLKPILKEQFFMIFVSALSFSSFYLSLELGYDFSQSLGALFGSLVFCYLLFITFENYLYKSKTKIKGKVSNYTEYKTKFNILSFKDNSKKLHNEDGAAVKIVHDHFKEEYEFWINGEKINTSSTNSEENKRVFEDALNKYKLSKNLSNFN